MIQRPPRSTRTDTLFTYTTLFRSWHVCYSAMVYAEISKLERKLGIKIDPDWCVEEFWIKKGKDPSKRPRVPRALELDAIANGPPGIDRKSTRLNSSH